MIKIKLLKTPLITAIRKVYCECIADLNNF